MTSQELKPENYWCTQAPNVPRVWSSSSLSTFSECKRKFQYSYVEGWEGRMENLDFTFGSGFHRCLEWYWRQRLTEKLDPEEALNSTVGVAMALGLFLPPPSRDKQKGKTRKGLVNAIVWYIDKWQSVDAPEDIFTSADGTPAIEQRFTIDIGLMNPDGENYLVQGYVDQLRNFSFNLTTWDYKSTTGDPSEWYLSDFDLSLQCAIYTIAARTLSNEIVTAFMADVCGVDTRVKELPYEMHAAFLKRKIVTMTPADLDEHLLDVQSMIKEAERCAEQNYWPKNTKACRFCQYREICAKDPGVREAFLSTEFKKKRRVHLNIRKE